MRDIQKTQLCCGGFTLVEVLVVLVVLFSVVWVAVPHLSLGMVRAKGLQETQNLRSIEVAKASYAVENTGVDLLYVSQLEEYFPKARLPVSPWGVAYEDVLTLGVVVRSQANGNPLMEPRIEPLDANGFNDLASPGLVYVEKVSPSEFILDMTLWEAPVGLGALQGEFDLKHPRKGVLLDRDHGHGNDPGKYDESNPGVSDPSATK